MCDVNYHERLYLPMLPCPLPILLAENTNEEDRMFEWVARLLAQINNPYSYLTLLNSCVEVR